MMVTAIWHHTAVISPTQDGEHRDAVSKRTARFTPVWQPGAGCGLSMQSSHTHTGQPPLPLSVAHLCPLPCIPSAWSECKALKVEEQSNFLLRKPDETATESHSPSDLKQPNGRWTIRCNHCSMTSNFQMEVTSFTNGTQLRGIPNKFWWLKNLRVNGRRCSASVFGNRKP